MADTKSEYLLQWINHENEFPSRFFEFLQKDEFIDVTLAADGYLFSAHRLVLSAASSYFRKMFSELPSNQQPIGKFIESSIQMKSFKSLFSKLVVLNDISWQILDNLMAFIYCGEVNIGENNLEEFLSAAKCLEIKGMGCDDNSSHSKSTDVGDRKRILDRSMEQTKEQTNSIAKRIKTDSHQQSTNSLGQEEITEKAPSIDLTNEIVNEKHSDNNGSDSGCMDILVHHRME